MESHCQYVLEKTPDQTLSKKLRYIPFYCCYNPPGSSCAKALSGNQFKKVGKLYSHPNNLSFGVQKDELDSSDSLRFPSKAHSPQFQQSEKPANK